MYRFIWNERFSHRELLKGLYGIAQRTVAEPAPSHVVVALDPVNFETPYTKKLEGVSTAMKSTPPGPTGQKRLTPGYPAMTATVVNLPEPVVTYANWFSYVTEDFVNENREIYRSIRIARALFPHAKLRFVADSGLDDQKIFRQMALVDAEFIIRACHNRKVEVHNDRLDRWEEELLDALTATVPLVLRLQVAFTSILPAMLKPCTPSDAFARRLSTRTALTRKTGWRSKTCACRPWSVCVASSS